MTDQENASASIQRVLVVDDNAQNRALVEAHLVAEGYAVTLAESGREALASFAAQLPDLVLLDVLMPGMDGFEACRQLRTMRGGADVPVVFVTALADLGSHKQALESGADDFLTKPIHRTELLLRVRSLLWIKRLRDELKRGYDLIRSQRDALIVAQRHREELTELIVHDLKNPLAAIEMTASYLSSMKSAPDDLREASREIVDSAGAMRRMVMNLIDIGRSEDGGLTASCSDVDVKVLIEGVVRELSRHAAYKEVELRALVPADAGPIQADLDLLRRLFENLIVNAVRYAPKRTPVEITAAHGTAAVEIRICDRGPGIPEAFREKVFEKYVRLESDTSVALGNRGLGLTFCRMAAEAHGGRIWVEPNEPSGSVFVVHLPRRHPSTAHLGG